MTNGSVGIESAIEGLFPPGVMVAFGDPSSFGPSPFPEEEAAIERAVPKRQGEFRAGRECSRRALGSLGLAVGAIPVLPNRAPAWPDGVVGAITHCDGFAGAAVAWRRDHVGLGLDAELAEPLKESLARLICTDAEALWIRELEPPQGTDWGKLIFSAKEAVYKCVGPLVGRWVGFREVTIDVDAPRQEFRVHGEDDRLAGELPLGRIRGRYAVAGGVVLTAALLPAPLVGSR